MAGAGRAGPGALLVLALCARGAAPGANDLHFQDGVTTADVIGGDIFFEIIDPPELEYSYRIRPAKDFGATFNESVNFREVHLVPTLPLDGCTDIENADDVFGQVALIARGECSFVHKSKKAEEAGARAVVITEVHDMWDHTYDNLIEMVDDKMDYEVQIPAGFLLGKSGYTIIKKLDDLQMNYAVINLPVNMTFVPISKMKQPPWIGW